MQRLPQLYGIYNEAVLFSPRFEDSSVGIGSELNFLAS